MITKLLDIPSPPSHSPDDVMKCKQAGDFRPLLFDWYKYVGLLCNAAASIRRESRGIRKLPSVHYSVLIGLLNRCSRLMFGNVALSHEGFFGETTSILDRCIFESAVKMVWLCQKRDEDSFTRYLSDGLKTELELRDRIHTDVAKRGGRTLVIEERMLRSIENYFASSGLKEDQIRSAKKLPTMPDMIKALKLDRIVYTVAQGIGSHHVHGTWPSLRFHYLREADGVLGPRDHDCQTHVSQYVFVPLVILDSIDAFMTFVCLDEVILQSFLDFVHGIRSRIRQLNVEAVGNGMEFTDEM